APRPGRRLGSPSEGSTYWVVIGGLGSCTPVSLLPPRGAGWPHQPAVLSDSARSLLFEHPNVLLGHPQPGVRPVSHAGTLDLHPLNELQPLTLQLLSVPLGHPHDLAAANVVFDVDDKHTSASEHPD